MSLPVKLLEALEGRFGDRLATGMSQRGLLQGDESWHAGVLPQAVIFPETTDEIAAVLALCSRHGVPVTAVGAGSGQEGGAIPASGGISLSLQRMNRVLNVDAANMDCHVEAGVTRLALGRHLWQSGLMFPVDPGADATLGGMAATGAAGTMTPMYGAMGANVLGMQVVLADGRILETGSRAAKSSAGYDLTRLFLGSEGTLGVISRLRLRLHPEPEAIATFCAFLPDVRTCIDLVIALRQLGLPLARAELCDAVMVRGFNLRQTSALPELPMLLLEFHGSESAIEAASVAARGLLRDAEALNIAQAQKTEDRRQLWATRHGAAEAERLLRPGSAAIVTDVAVPLDDLAPLLDAARARLAANDMIAPLTCHVADGNFHFALLVVASDADEIAKAEDFKEWLADQAIALGGTISGEHGIGLGKRQLMPRQHGAALEVMRSIKLALDPANLLNPGKVLPPAAPDG